MRRRLSGTAAAVLVAASFINTTAAAADGVGRPDHLRSTWVQSDPAALDGIGAYLYIAPQAAPGPTQLAADYDYVLEFSYSASLSPGGIGFGTHAGGAKFAALATGGSGTVIVPYNWSQGRLYFLFVHRLGNGAWGGWVLDVWAEEWTFIGQGSSPLEWGRLGASNWTTVSWEDDSESTNSCSAYPATDAFFTPVFGVRNGSFTLATLGATSVGSRGCPGEISSLLGWARYRLGQ